MTRKRVLSIALLLAAAACGGGGEGSAASPATAGGAGSGTGTGTGAGTGTGTGAGPGTGTGTTTGTGTGTTTGTGTGTGPGTGAGSTASAPGSPPVASADANPPPPGGSGSNRFQIGVADGLYLQDPAAGEPTIAGFVVVTLRPISGGSFIPPADTVVTLNGTPLHRDPALNGAYWRVDPAATQPPAGSGGRLVLVATATVNGKVEERTLVLPCPADVEVSTTPAVGAPLAPGGTLRITSTSSVSLNPPGLPGLIEYPKAILRGFDPATRALSAIPGSGAVAVAAGPVDVTLPVGDTAAPAYVAELRWPGPWVLDGETGGFCGLAKRWGHAR